MGVLTDADTKGLADQLVLTATSTTVATPGWQTWTVTAHVQAHHTGPNNGFVVRDQSEGAVGGLLQRYDSRENSSLRRPELVLTWG